jgi:putative peptidoglycan lipid II flippase
LPSFVLVKVMEPSFFSRKDTKTPMKIAILCLINNVILNYVFYILEMGFVGIILASVFSSYLNLTLLISNLIRKKLFYFEKDFVKIVYKFLIFVI